METSTLLIASLAVLIIGFIALCRRMAILATAVIMSACGVGDVLHRDLCTFETKLADLQTTLDLIRQSVRTIDKDVHEAALSTRRD